MNRGLIVGSVYYDEGNGKNSNYPYEGALVTLRCIMTGRNFLEIGVPKTSKPLGHYIINHQKTDENGNFSLPFIWSGHEFGDLSNSSIFQVSAISKAGRKPASDSANGKLKARVDTAYLTSIVAEEVLGMPAKFMKARAIKAFNKNYINKAFHKHFEGGLDLYEALTKSDDHYTNEATKLASTEVLKAIGHCTLRL